jgi:hypothetical protein
MIQRQKMANRLNARDEWFLPLFFTFGGIGLLGYVLLFGNSFFPAWMEEAAFGFGLCLIVVKLIGFVVLGVGSLAADALRWAFRVKSE